MTYEQPGAYGRPGAGVRAATAPRRRYKSSGGAKRGKNGRKAQRPTWRKFLGWKAFVLYFLGAMLLFFIGVGIAYTNTVIPDANEAMRTESTIVYWNDGETELGRFEAEKRIRVGYDEMPQHLRDAVVAAEDRSFYENSGFDPVGIARAGFGFVSSGGEIEGGGSTISQQYVKNLYLTEDQTLTRKIDELFISIKVNQEMDKNDIITDYLNMVWFGGQVYGVEVASQRFFGKSVSELNVAESASMAALIKQPTLYDPRFEENVARFNERFRYVMDGMVATGAIDQATADATKPPKFKKYKEDSNQYKGTDGYLLEAVRQELTTCDDESAVAGESEDDTADEDTAGDGEASTDESTDPSCEPPFTEEELNTGGYRIVSTFDKKRQKAAINAVKEEGPEDRLDHTHIGLAAVVPGDGAVVAAYGGPNYLKQAFDNSLQAEPSVGSTIKPLTLVAAFEHGISLDNRFAGNSPYEYEGLETPINNQGDADYGELVTLEEATESSINTAFVDLVMELGGGQPREGGKIVEEAVFRAGIPEDTEDLAVQELRSTLGIAPISPVDLADAYATLAAGGRQTDWYTVETVTDRGGNVVYEGKDELETVIEPNIVAEVTHALTEVVEDGSGHEAQALDRPSAGKTGTHEDATLWYSGYVPQLAASVAIFRQNYDTGEKMNLEEAYGGSSEYPARIWTAFMQAALEGEDVIDFPERSNIGDPLNTPTPTAPPTPTDEPTEEETTEEPEEPEETRVPNVIGRSLADAISRLDDRGLRAGSITERETANARPDTVISSNPPEGTEVEAGSAVDLVVAKQSPGPVQVPDVVGQFWTDAEAELEQAGFAVNTADADPSTCDDWNEGVVESQDPTGSAPAGSTVTIYLIPSCESDGGNDNDGGDQGGDGGNNGNGPGPDTETTAPSTRRATSTTATW